MEPLLLILLLLLMPSPSHAGCDYPADPRALPCGELDTEAVRRFDASKRFNAETQRYNQRIKQDTDRYNSQKKQLRWRNPFYFQ